MRKRVDLVSKKPNQKHQIRRKKGPEEQFIVPSQPLGKINIEVGRPLICVPSRSVRQRAPTTIERNNGAFNKHAPGHNFSPDELPQEGSHRYQHNAAGKEQPRRRMQRLHRHQTAPFYSQLFSRNLIPRKHNHEMSAPLPSPIHPLFQHHRHTLTRFLADRPA